MTTTTRLVRPEVVAELRAVVERYPKRPKLTNLRTAVIHRTSLPGNFIKFASDQEKKTLWFTGEHQIVEKPAVDWTTKQEIPGRITRRWRWQVYDVSDINNPSEASIWERGYKESSQIMHFLSEKNQELVVVRNGRPNSKDTTYLIYPAPANR
jgi:hypothetical protein